MSDRDPTSLDAPASAEAGARTRLPVAVTIPVRFRDVDGMGHVNNAVFSTYLETGREAYWRAVGDQLGRDLGRSLASYDFILARLECDFRAQIPYGGAVVVRLGCPRLGTKSWDFVYRIEASQGDVLYAEARSVQVWFDYSAQATAPIPEPVREAIGRLESAETS